jgi:uncharacterized protein
MFRASAVHTRSWPSPQVAPAAAAGFLGFARPARGRLSRGAGTGAGLIAATGLLGPRSLRDIRRAAHATIGPGPERAEEFDAIFDEVFLGRVLAAPAPGDGRGSARRL